MRDGDLTAGDRGARGRPRTTAATGCCARRGTTTTAVFLAGLLSRGRRAGPGRAAHRRAAQRRPTNAATRRPACPASRSTWPAGAATAPRPTRALDDVLAALAEQTGAAPVTRHTTWCPPPCTSASPWHRLGQLVDDLPTPTSGRRAGAAGRRPGRRGARPAPPRRSAGYRASPTATVLPAGDAAAPPTSAPPAACRRRRARDGAAHGGPSGATGCWPGGAAGGWPSWTGRAATSGLAGDVAAARSPAPIGSPARAGGRPAARRRADQRRAGPAALHLAEHRRRPRVQHPGQAGVDLAHPGRGAPARARPARPRAVVGPARGSDRLD